MKVFFAITIVVLFFSCSVQAEEVFDDTSCYHECPMTPGGQVPAEFFNLPTFRFADNCHALQGLCHWVNMTSPLALKPVIVADYDGTQTSEKISIHAHESYISDRARSENSIAFGVIAPKLKSMGYDIGMQVNGLPNLYAAKYIAARDDACENTIFNSPQVKFDYCMSSRMAGMTAQQVRALHNIMFRVFPSLNNYFLTSQAVLNYLVAMGYPLWMQTGGTPYPAITKAKMHSTVFNALFSTKACDFVAQNSTTMNKLCPIVYDAPKISLHKVTLVMNTENVCDGVSYAEANEAGKAPLCIDDSEGKVSGLQTIERRTQNVVLSFHGNSNGDLYPGLFVVKNGGIVFIHNNPLVCASINKEVSGSCFNIDDADSEMTKILNSPDDDVYAAAAKAEGLTDFYKK